MEDGSEDLFLAILPDDLPDEPIEIDPGLTPGELRLVETPTPESEELSEDQLDPAEETPSSEIQPEATQPGPTGTHPTLAERLHKIDRGKNEQREAYLGKAARLAGRHADEELDLKDLKDLKDSLIVWRFEPVEEGGETWVQARRIVWVNPGWERRLSRYEDPERRKVSRNADGNIVLLARAAFTGSDLKAVYQIEKANLTAKPAPAPRPIPPEVSESTEEPETAAADEPPAELPVSPEPELEPEPKSKQKPKQPKPKRRQAAKPRYFKTASGLRLTAREKTALQHIAESSEEEKDSLAAAGKRNKLTLEDLLATALEDDLIDLTPLEERLAPQLTTTQELTARLLFALGDFEDRIKQLSPAGLKSADELYEALGVQPNQHALAFLIVKQAGYLED